MKLDYFDKNVPINLFKYIPSTYYHGFVKITNDPNKKINCY